jgi:hypothetical protein
MAGEGGAVEDDAVAGAVGRGEVAVGDPDRVGERAEVGELAAVGVLEECGRSAGSAAAGRRSPSRSSRIEVDSGK